MIRLILVPVALSLGFFLGIAMNGNTASASEPIERPQRHVFSLGAGEQYGGVVGAMYRYRLSVPFEIGVTAGPNLNRSDEFDIHPFFRFYPQPAIHKNPLSGGSKRQFYFQAVYAGYRETSRQVAYSVGIEVFEYTVADLNISFYDSTPTFSLSATWDWGDDVGPTFRQISEADRFDECLRTHQYASCERSGNFRPYARQASRVGSRKGSIKGSRKGSGKGVGKGVGKGAKKSNLLNGFRHVDESVFHACLYLPETPYCSRLAENFALLKRQYTKVEREVQRYTKRPHFWKNGPMLQGNSSQSWQSQLNMTACHATLDIGPNFEAIQKCHNQLPRFSRHWNAAVNDENEREIGAFQAVQIHKEIIEYVSKRSQSLLKTLQDSLEAAGCNNLDPQQTSLVTSVKCHRHIETELNRLKTSLSSTDEIYSRLDELLLLSQTRSHSLYKVIQTDFENYGCRTYDDIQRNLRKCGVYLDQESRRIKILIASVDAALKAKDGLLTFSKARSEALSDKIRAHLKETNCSDFDGVQPNLLACQLYVNLESERLKNVDRYHGATLARQNQLLAFATERSEALLAKVKMELKELECDGEDGLWINFKGCQDYLNSEWDRARMADTALVEYQTTRSLAKDLETRLNVYWLTTQLNGSPECASIALDSTDLETATACVDLLQAIRPSNDWDSNMLYRHCLNINFENLRKACGKDSTCLERAAEIECGKQPR